MVRIKLKHIISDRDRHGNVRYYFRHAGKKTRLPGLPGSTEFMDAYQKALGGAALTRRAAGVPGGPETVKWLCERYYESLKWRGLDRVTRLRRRAKLDQLCQRDGSLPYSRMEARHALESIQALAKTPHAANGLLKAMRGLFKFAKSSGHIEHNVMRDVQRFDVAPGGHYSWRTEDIRRYKAKHPLGTRPHLALCLLMYTGQRRSDVVRLGKQHIQDGGLAFTQAKNAKNKPVRLWLPILPDLQAAMDACPSKGLTFLETAYGRPFSSAGFGLRFKAWCRQAGLPHCSAHGVRKAAATIAAENGATAHQLMAIFGWSTLEQAELYTRAADQKRISKLSMDLIVPLKVPPEKQRGKSNG